MTQEEAKQWLKCARPDDMTPSVVEARLISQSDPELAEWLKNEEAFNHSVRNKLSEIRPPGDLRERILAGRSTVVHPSWWTRPAWQALAAAVVALLVFSGFWLRGPGVGSGDDFRTQMVQYMDLEWDHGFDVSDPTYEKIAAWLASRPDGTRLDIPAPLAGARTYGCKELTWRGRPVKLICFVPEGQTDVVHVLSVRKTPEMASVAGSPVFKRNGEWNTALWTRGEYAYLALTTADRAKLADVLVL